MDERNVPAPQPGGAYPPQYSPYQPPAVPPKPRLRFTVKDWVFVFAALLLAWLCMTAYSAKDFLDRGAAGLGVAVFVTALLAAILLRLGRGAKGDAFGIFCAVCALLLGWSCFLCSNPWLYVLNAFAALCAVILAAFSLSGQLRRAAATAGQFFEAIGLFFLSIFKYIPAPFQALGTQLRGDRKRLYGVLIGLLCAVPVLVVVLLLLSSADAVFGGIFTSFADWLRETNLLRWLWWLVRLLFVALLFCSGLYFLTQPRVVEPAPTAPAQPRQAHSATPFVTVLALLNVVYAVFAVIQVVYLFGGAETAAMLGGYAQYARSGFFQLVGVAIINLVAVLLTALWLPRCELGPQCALKTLSLLLGALTLVILASAVYRMGLYISVYGLSLLRLLTLWAMLVILAGLVAASVKTLKPSFLFFRVFFIFALSSWVLLNLACPARLIAEYNVSAYLSGSVDSFDLQYVTGELVNYRKADVLHALRRLAAAGAYPEREMLSDAIRAIESRLGAAPWQFRNLWDLVG